MAAILTLSLFVTSAQLLVLLGFILRYLHVQFPRRGHTRPQHSVARQRLIIFPRLLMLLVTTIWFGAHLAVEIWDDIWICRAMRRVRSGTYLLTRFSLYFIMYQRIIITYKYCGFTMKLRNSLAIWLLIVVMGVKKRIVVPVVAVGVFWMTERLLPSVDA